MTLVCLIVGFTQLAHAQTEDITSTLEVYRITTNQDGEETATQVSAIKPGDILEYRLTYTNNLANPIRNLQPALPIPGGMKYLGTAQPEIESASLTLSGGSFQDLPIMREVELPNGRTAQREVPASEYRRLRWGIEQLGAGESVTLTARVRVLSNTSQ